jgi:Dynein heavy chain AAA lid domain
MVISEACSTLNKSSSSTSNGGLDWDTVHGLMEDAIYGGRVESTQDMRLLTTYLKRYFNAEVC